MLKESVVSFCQNAYGNHLRRKRLRFFASIPNMREVQLQKIMQLVQQNQATRYGSRHNFASIKSYDDYRKTVPLCDYDDLISNISEIEQGHQGVLSHEKVQMLERSSGSTSATKHIPYTQGLKNEFSQATDIWIADLYEHFSDLPGTSSYFAISPIGAFPKATSGGVPLGFEDDTEYFPPLARWLWRQTMAVPPEVARLTDMDEWFEATSLGLLRSERLGVVSVWSPTFLCNILDYMAANWTFLLSKLSDSRRKRLEHFDWQAWTNAKSGKSTYNPLPASKGLWPRLQVVSCWTDGVSQRFSEPLKRFFAGCCVQPKGLLATEGVVSFPLLETLPGGHLQTHNVLAYQSHFYEFRDLENEEIVLADALRKGGTYSPILSTAGGLYRYQLKDAVLCKGHFRGLPSLEFLAKNDRVSDLFGEKLNARFVESCLQELKDRHKFDPRFFMLAPTSTDKWRYTAFVETHDEPLLHKENTLPQIALHLETLLQKSHHYGYCRQLGQLGALKIKKVKQGQKIYEESLRNLGTRPGTIKPTVLDKRLHWEVAFGSAEALNQLSTGRCRPNQSTKEQKDEKRDQQR